MEDIEMIRSTDTDTGATDVDTDKAARTRYVKLEEVDDPIKIRSWRGVITVSKKLLMKSRYFEAFFNRWSKDITHIDLPDDVDPEIFMEVIYKLRNPNHVIKYKVVKDYYDYYGVDYEKKNDKKEQPETEDVKTFKDIITIPTSTSPTNYLANEFTIRHIEFTIHVPALQFSYSVLKGLYKSRNETSQQDKEYARRQFEILSKDKSHYIKLVEKVPKVPKSEVFTDSSILDKEKIFYLCDMDISYARENTVTFVIPVKSFISINKAGSPLYNFSIQVSGGGQLEISANVKRK